MILKKFHKENVYSGYKGHISVIMIERAGAGFLHTKSGLGSIFHMVYMAHQGRLRVRRRPNVDVCGVFSRTR